MAYTVDEESRISIINDINKSLFVEASAGSGKTTMLVRRMVAMVESDENIDISKICAITFTKAAATEFYGRFQKLLSERSVVFKSKNYRPGDLPDPTPVTAKRCQEALKKINLCFLGTIDSFCNMVLSEHPIEALVPSSSSVKLDYEMDNIYLREYHKIINGEYGIEAFDKYLEFIKWFDNPEKVFLSAIPILMRNRSYDIKYDNPIANFDEKIKKYEYNIKKIFEFLLKNEKSLKYDGDNGSKDAWKKLNNYKNLLLSNWKNNYEKVFEILKSIIKDLRIKNNEENLVDLGIDNLYFPNDTNKYFCFVYKSKNKEEKRVSYIEEVINLYNEQKFSICLSFVSCILPTLSNNLRKNGELTFFDYLLYLRNCLKEDVTKGGHLIKHIYNRHSYFLIDEFQDTDPLQSEIFFYLSSEKLDVDWKKCVPRPGSLFIVGDPKQSIYRFKNADVVQFMRVKNLFKGEVGKVCYLYNNFRSINTILAGFNNIFSELLKTETNSQSKFDKVPITDKKDLNVFKGYYYFKGSEKKDINVNCIINLIKQIVNNDDYLIEYKNSVGNLDTRKIEYKDIMVIPYTTTPLEDYIKFFYKANIPFFLEGKTDFNHSPIINNAMAIFKVLLYPENKNYLYEALFNDYFKYELDDFYYLASTGFKYNLNCDLDELGLDEKYYNDLNKLKNAIDYFNSCDIIESINYIINYFELFKYVSTYNLEYLYFTIELFRTNIENKIINNKNECIIYYNDLIDNNKLERSLSLAKSNNKVHVANLHKVKGLEAPVCILPFQNRKDKNASIHIDTDTNSCYIFNVPKNKISNYSETNKNSEFIKLENDMLKEEDLRKIYVAVTRSKNLCFVGSVKTKANSEHASNPYGILLQFIDKEFEIKPQVNEIINSKSVNDLITKSTDFSQYKSCEASYEIIKPSDLDNDDIIYTNNYKKDNINNNIIATLKGTIVHRFMELFVSSGMNNNNIKEIINYIINENCSHLDNKEDYELILNNVAFNLLNGGFKQNNFLNDNIIEVLHNATEIYCEMPFSYRIQNKIIYGIMDLVIKYNNEWLIIDYKTNEEINGLEEHYKTQLDNYVKAFKELTGNDAKAYIYHISA